MEIVTIESEEAQQLAGPVVLELAKKIRAEFDADKSISEVTSLLSHSPTDSIDSMMERLPSFSAAKGCTLKLFLGTKAIMELIQKDEYNALFPNKAQMLKYVTQKVARSLSEIAITMWCSLHNRLMCVLTKSLQKPFNTTMDLKRFVEVDFPRIATSVFTCINPIDIIKLDYFCKNFEVLHHSADLLTLEIKRSDPFVRGLTCDVDENKLFLNYGQRLCILGNLTPPAGMPVHEISILLTHSIHCQYYNYR